MSMKRFCDSCGATMSAGNTPRTTNNNLLIAGKAPIGVQGAAIITLSLYAIASPSCDVCTTCIANAIRALAGVAPAGAGMQDAATIAAAPATVDATVQP